MSKRVALVTGGVRGIPRALTLDLLASRYAVGVCYRTSKPQADELTATVGDAARFLAVPADVSSPQEAESLFHQVRDTLGPVDVLINGAGPYHRVPVLKETPDGWRSMIDNNLNSAFYMSRLVAPDMIEKGWGRIISFSMANADRLSAQPGVTAHYIAKSGLLTLTRTLAKKLAPHGITVNAISPGFIQTESSDPQEMASMVPRIPAGRLGTPDDAVQVMRFLLSEASNYVNGTNIHLSGAWGL